MSYVTNFGQRVVDVPESSSNTNLTTLECFVGLASSTLSVAGIQISLASDINAHIYVDQSPGKVTGVGTVALADSTAIAGTLTRFERDFIKGDEIFLDSDGTLQSRIVDEVTSDTEITLTVATTGGTLSGKAYQFYPWDISDFFEFNSVKGIYAETTGAINSYFRVRVCSIALVTSEFFRLQSILCPIASPLPRALTHLGNLKTEAMLTWNPTSLHALIDHTNHLSVATTSRLVGVVFNETQKDGNFWVDAVTGTGAVTLADNIYSLVSSGDTGTATLNSVRVAQFVPGTTNVFRAIAKTRLDGTTLGGSGNILRLGPYNADNGFFFELDDATFTIVSRTGGVDTKYAIADWNKSNHVLDITKYHVFDIHYSVESVEFYGDGELLHQLSIVDQVTRYSKSNAMPITFESNSGGVTASYLDIAVAVIWRMGSLKSAPALKHIDDTTSTVCKYSGGVLHKVIIGTGNNNAVITVWDNITNAAPVMSVIKLPNSTEPVVLPFDAPFYTGLTIQSDDPAVDITVIYEEWF